MFDRPGPPPLAVVVVSFNPNVEVLQRCLYALTGQPHAHSIEITVVRDWHRHGANGFQAICTRFPGIRLLDAREATIPHMRRIGLGESRGEIVALIEDDCMVNEAWAAAILLAHREPSVAVGGAVEPGPYRRALDWAVYFCDYSRFMLPFTGGNACVLAGNNVSYKREVLPQVVALAESAGLQEAFVHQALCESGKSLIVDPRIIVHNEHTWSLADVSRMPFHHGRAFGGQRAADWSPIRRLAFLLAAPVLPLVHVIRIVRRVLGRRRAVFPLVRALPWIAMFGVSWAAGESVGYAAGPGTSLRHWR